ncbi:MAG: DUF4136 domain-containing protein [Desulfofustis sp.]|nr:DUF4136 domain-containing protein [Desulfofustis sp.]
MMMRIAWAFMFVIVAGCAQLQTGSEIDEATDFTKLKTFSWLHDTDKPADDVRLNDPKIRQTVRTAVEESLLSKGYEQAEGPQADFLVTWFGAIEQKIKKENIDHFYAPYGYGTLYRDPVLNIESPRTILEYEKGTIIIDIVDPKNQKLIWRGSGSGKLAEDQPEQTALRNLNRSVTKILEPFPPRQ